MTVSKLMYAWCQLTQWDVPDCDGPGDGVLDCGLWLHVQYYSHWRHKSQSCLRDCGFHHILIIGSFCLCHATFLRPVTVPRKCAPYMGALAAAGCAWSVRGDPGYGGKWAWLTRRGRCTASSWAQRAVRVDWGLSYTTVQATIAHCGLYILKYKYLLAWTYRRIGNYMWKIMFYYPNPLQWVFKVTSSCFSLKMW